MVNIVLTDDCYDSPPTPYIIRNLLETYLEIIERGSEVNSMPGIPEFGELLTVMAGEAEFEYLHDIAMEAYETELRFEKNCQTFDEFMDLLEEGELDDDLFLDREDFAAWTICDTVLTYLTKHNLFYCLASPTGKLTYINSPVIGVW